jgi:hypothetical protein
MSKKVKDQPKKPLSSGSCIDVLREQSYTRNHVSQSQAAYVKHMPGQLVQPAGAELIIDI